MAALALAGAALPALLSLGQGLSFWADEWDYVTTLQQGFSLFRPSNGHWYAIPNAIWWVLLSTAGLRSYVPYLVVLLAMHIATCLVLFALLRRRAGSGAALVSMAVLLFSGYGSAVIFWALMITYLGSTLCGLLALLLLDGPATNWRRAALAAVLLLAATASSGMGLGFLVAAAVELAVDPDRRRYLATLLLPAAGFGAWFALFGVHGTLVQPLGSAWQTAGGYVEFVLVAVMAGSAAIFGMPAVAGPMAIGLIAAALALTRRVDARTLGAAAGLLFQFTLVAMVRATGGIDSATESRYVYVATIYVLLLVTPAAARVFAARWPWRTAPIALAIFSVAINFCGLAVYTQIHRDTIAYQSAELETVSAVRGAPDLRPNAFIDDQMPTVGTYFALTASLGSPVAPVTQANLSRLPGAPVDRVLSRVLAIRESPATAPPASAVCGRTAGAGLADLSDPSGGWLDVQAAPGTRVELFPWLLLGPQQQPTATFTAPASGWEAIELPRTAQPVTWHLRIQSSEPVQAWRCGQESS